MLRRKVFRPAAPKDSRFKTQYHQKPGLSRTLINKIKYTKKKEGWMDVWMGAIFQLLRIFGKALSSGALYFGLSQCLSQFWIFELFLKIKVLIFLSFPLKREKEKRRNSFTLPCLNLEKKNHIEHILQVYPPSPA